MKTVFNKFNKAILRRNAENVEVYIKKRDKVQAKIDKLNAELEEINNQIKIIDSSTVAMTGFSTEDIIKKTVIITDKLDDNGNNIKKVKFEFIYPDTIIPPVEKMIEEDSMEKEETTEENSNINIVSYYANDNQ